MFRALSLTHTHAITLTLSSRTSTYSDALNAFEAGDKREEDSQVAALRRQLEEQQERIRMLQEQAENMVKDHESRLEQELAAKVRQSH